MVAGHYCDEPSRRAADGTPRQLGGGKGEPWPANRIVVLSSKNANSDYFHRFSKAAVEKMTPQFKLPRYFLKGIFFSYGVTWIYHWPTDGIACVS